MLGSDEEAKKYLRQAVQSEEASYATAAASLSQATHVSERSGTVYSDIFIFHVIMIMHDHKCSGEIMRF